METLQIKSFSDLQQVKAREYVHVAMRQSADEAKKYEGQTFRKNVLICGGIGGGAIAAMAEAGIKVYAGASGNADDAVASYIAGTLPESGDATCDHHDHEGHGDHDCGHGGCHH